MVGKAKRPSPDALPTCTNFCSSSESRKSGNRCRTRCHELVRRNRPLLLGACPWKKGKKESQTHVSRDIGVKKKVGKNKNKNNGSEACQEKRKGTSKFMKQI